MEEQIEIQRQFRQTQEKYVYYIIALCVAAIGFSIYSTTGKPLKWIQLPLAFAVFSWGISIFCGLTFMAIVLSSLYANNALLDVSQGKHPDVGIHPQRIAAGVEGIKNAIMAHANALTKYGRYQEFLFYFGIVSFIIWHILEMSKI